MFSLIVMPMSAKQQYIFGIINILLLFIIGSKNQKRLLTMIFLSLLMSTRYLYWRATTHLILIPLLKGYWVQDYFWLRFYSWIILVLGYFQTAWPLNEKIAPLPKKISRYGQQWIFMYLHITKV